MPSICAAWRTAPRRSLGPSPGTSRCRRPPPRRSRPSFGVRAVTSFSMTAPRSLRELFDQLGLEVVESTDDTVVLEMPVDERTTNTAGGLQGGLIATMADV